MQCKQIGPIQKQKQKQKPVVYLNMLHRLDIVFNINLNTYPNAKGSKSALYANCLLIGLCQVNAGRS